jgi:hypothetical protein
MAYGVCSCPGCSKEGTKLCSQCGEAAYCSSDCQKQAWVTGHKEQCRLATKPEVVSVTQRMDDLSLKQLKNLVIAKAAQFSNPKRTIVLGKLEKSEKDKAQLLKMAVENVKVEEVEPLLTGRGGAASSDSGGSGVRGGSGGVGGGGGSGKKLLSRKDKAKAALQEHKMPSQEQLRRQAREMCRNPEMIRRANPEMRHFTDAQIREQAKEMEKMASNPDMINAMMKMQSMPEAEKAALNQLQQGLAGKVTRDEKWIAETIRFVKGQPDTLKMLFKGRADLPFSESQLVSIIDFVVSCSDRFLINVVRFLNWLVSMRGPAVAMYTAVDDATMGCARYLAIGVMLLFMFYMAKLLWYVVTLILGLVMSGFALLTGSGASAAQAAGRGSADLTSGATVEPTANDEAPFVEL